MGLFLYSLDRYPFSSRGYLLLAACIHRQLLLVPAAVLVLNIIRIIAMFHRYRISKSIYTSSIHQSRVCPHIIAAKSATFIFFFGFVMMCGCPTIVVDVTFALLFFFGGVLLHIIINNYLFVVIITFSSCLPSCSSDLLFLHLAGLTHLTIIVRFKVSKARLIFEESTY